MHVLKSLSPGAAALSWGLLLQAQQSVTAQAHKQAFRRATAGRRFFAGAQSVWAMRKDEKLQHCAGRWNGDVKQQEAAILCKKTTKSSFCGCGRSCCHYASVSI